MKRVNSASVDSSTAAAKAASVLYSCGGWWQQLFVVGYGWLRLVGRGVQPVDYGGGREAPHRPNPFLLHAHHEG